MHSSRLRTYHWLTVSWRIRGGGGALSEEGRCLGLGGGGGG